MALGGLPAPPAAPLKVESGSSESSLMMAWPESPGVDGVPIEGYTLYMDDGLLGELVRTYDGSQQPLTLRFLASNLTTGLPYRFAVTAHNANGESAQSAATTVYACLRPSGLPAPRVTSHTRTSIGVAWDEPVANGCPITGFTLLRNTGADDPATVAVDPLLLADQASLREHLVSGLAPTGASFRIVVRAHNLAGSFDSPPTVVVLAAPPDTPTSAPSSAAEITDGTRVGVRYGPLADA